MKDNLHVLLSFTTEKHSGEYIKKKFTSLLKYSPNLTLFNYFFYNKNLLFYLQILKILILSTINLKSYLPTLKFHLQKLKIYLRSTLNAPKTIYERHLKQKTIYEYLKPRFYLRILKARSPPLSTINLKAPAAALSTIYLK